MLRQPRTRGLCPLELDKLEHKLARDKEIVERRVFDVTTLNELGTETGVTKERVRQITKRASRGIAELAGAHPRFAMMAEYRKPKAPAARVRRAVAVAPVSILPALGQAHNTLSRVVAILPDARMSPIAGDQDAVALDGVTDAMLADAGGARADAPVGSTRH